MNFSIRRALFGLVVAVLILFVGSHLLDFVRLFLVPDRNAYQEHFLTGTVAPFAALISLTIALAWHTLLGTKWVLWSLAAAILPGVIAALFTYFRHPEFDDWLGLGIVAAVTSGVVVAAFWLVAIANEHLKDGS